jgi:hypothetical protein
MEFSGQLHASAALFPGKDPRTHWIEDWVGPRAGLDAVTKRNISVPLPEIELRSSGPVTVLTELHRLPGNKKERQVEITKGQREKKKKEKKGNEEGGRIERERMEGNTERKNRRKQTGRGRTERGKQGEEE